MGQLIDNLLAFRILYSLIKPFNKTDAFALGIIDANGNVLKHGDELKTQEEKDAFTYLDKLCFNLKRLLAKLPGGSSMLSSLVAAYFLIKENAESNNCNSIEEQFLLLRAKLDNDTCMIEEQLLVEKFICLMHDEVFGELNEDGEGGTGVGTPVNNTSQVFMPKMPIGAVKRRNNWKDLPKVFGAHAFEVSGDAYNGVKNAKAKGSRWDDHFKPAESDTETFDKIKQYSKTYSKRPILIKHKEHDAYQYIKN